MKSWYLIQTKPRQEIVAQENLNRQGYPTYLPMAQIRRRRNNRARTDIGPMFPRYLFIHLDAGIDDWRPLRSTVGVNNVVRFGSNPARVPDILITALRQREDNRGIQILPKAKLRKGQPVRVAEGLFEGYEGLFHAKTSRDRAIILINILDKQARIEIEQENIEVIS